jgi:phage shock protein PspC (stress-responsive transcriptional regulator)
MLANGTLSAKAWQSWEEIYQGVLNLQPETKRQEWLHDNMRGDIDTISDTRTNRELAAVGSVTDLFWIAAVGGLLLVVVPYFTFAPTVLHLVLLTIFATFNGLILFFIAALSNPYAEPEALEPLAFERLVDSWSTE